MKKADKTRTHQHIIIFMTVLALGLVMPVSITMNLSYPYVVLYVGLILIGAVSRWIASIDEEN